MKNSEASPSQDLASNIRNRIQGKVAIAAMGNIMRGDDGLGPRFIELLRQRSPKASLFDCGTVPENYIFPILSTLCDTLILVDAADLGIAPGEARVLGPGEIKNVGFSTHNSSPLLFIDLLRTGKEDMHIFVVSMQPKTTALGVPLSEEVLAGLDILVAAFAEALA